MPVGYTPYFQLFKDGNDITGQFQDRCTKIQVEITDGDGENDTATISLDDRDWLISRPFKGDKLQLHLGYREIGLAYMGEFEVGEVVFSFMPKQIDLVCNSSGTQGRLRAPTNNDFSNTTLGDIVKRIAQGAGLQAMVEEGLGSLKIDFRNQVTSGYHLINQLERQFGAMAKIENGKLIFVPRGALSNAEGRQMPVLVFDGSHFAQLQVRDTNRSEYRGVRASYRDQADNVRRFVEQGTQGGGEDNPTEWFQIDREFRSRAEAEAAAKARAAALRRATGDLAATMAKGDPWIRATQTMVIGSTRDGIDGSYEIRRAVHIYVKEQGIGTTIEAGPRGDGSGVDLSGRDPGTVLKPPPGGTIGEVLPGNQGRRQGPI